MKPFPTERGSSSVSSASRPITMPGGPTQYSISRHDDSVAAPYSTWLPAMTSAHRLWQTTASLSARWPSRHKRHRRQMH